MNSMNSGHYAISYRMYILCSTVLNSAICGHIQKRLSVIMSSLSHFFTVIFFLIFLFSWISPASGAASKIK